jgi:hypothetical protein
MTKQCLGMAARISASPNCSGAPGSNSPSTGRWPSRPPPERGATVRGHAQQVPVLPAQPGHQGDVRRVQPLSKPPGPFISSDSSSGDPGRLADLATSCPCGRRSRWWPVPSVAWWAGGRRPCRMPYRAWERSWPRPWRRRGLGGGGRPPALRSRWTTGSNPRRHEGRTSVGVGPWEAASNF